MSIRRKGIIHHYTIVEVMMAMGIFLVMMTIMMQFFTSAQKVWNLASKKNMMYADARVSMNLMTRELQSMLYDNDSDGTGIYPFWYQWTDMNVDTGAATPELSTADNYNVSYLTALNFISTTDLKSVDEGSDVCEIRYKFIPVYFDTTPTRTNAKGGKLQRCCTAEYYDNSGTATLTPSGTTDDYNFAANPYPTSNRVNAIWKPNTTALDFQTVITGVYALRFTCFAWSSTSGLASLDALDASGATQGPGTISGYDLITGTPKPVAVRIDMKLMAPKDLKKLAYYIHVANDTGSSTSEKNDAEKQIKILKQTMRTFSKVIYLGKD